jgi:hypothetical protein
MRKHQCRSKYVVPREITPTRTDADRITRGVGRGTSSLPGELIIFDRIVAFARREASLLVGDVVEAVPFDAGVERLLLGYGRAEVELAGVKMFNKVRCCYGDDNSFEWHDRVRGAMETRLLELIIDLNGSGGPYGPPSPEPPSPSSPTRIPAKFGLVWTEQHLSEKALEIATNLVAKYAEPDWSKEDVEDAVLTSADVAFDRVRRLWDPRRSPLLAYLVWGVKSGLMDAREQFITRRIGDRARERAATDQLEDLVRLCSAVGGVEQPVEEDELFKWLASRSRGAAEEMSRAGANRGEQQPDLVDRILGAVSAMTQYQFKSFVRYYILEDPGCDGPVKNAANRGRNNIRTEFGLE